MNVGVDQTGCDRAPGRVIDRRALGRKLALDRANHAVVADQNVPPPVQTGVGIEHLRVFDEQHNCYLQNL